MNNENKTINHNELKKLSQLIFEGEEEIKRNGFLMNCDMLAKILLENNVRLLPAPIGTTYYRIVVKRGKKENDYFAMIRKAELTWYNLESVWNDLGNTVFFSREKAEVRLPVISASINADLNVGDEVVILNMEAEPFYSGRTGTVELIDDAGQIHGTWGGCALIKEADNWRKTNA